MSEFRRVVCWREQCIEPVLNPDALQTSDAVFLATHNPMRLWRNSAISYDEHSFLKQFLKPNDYAFVPILGHAGMGKSHLVRWLGANIQSTTKRKVILVRKFATNLREIIRLIIHDAKGKIFDDYRTQLDAASSELISPEYAREKFLDNLALESSRNCARGLPSKISEELQYVVDKIPALLRDAVFRRVLLGRGNVIDRLTSHIIGKPGEITRLDERRRFFPEDIPSNVTDIREFQRAGADARELFTSFVSDPSLRKVAVDWLNASLNDSLAGLLALRNNRLSELMLELRRQLAREGTELVLLIEDFALLQGVDQQLMEALLVRTEQGEHGRLCAMRTALACTTGYYEGLPETVRQRVDFTVTLDPPSPEFQPAESELRAFAARYLNAIRTPERTLQEWYERVVTSGETDLPVASACTPCEHHSLCHGAFGTGGTSANFGLYPFSETALLRMQDRVSPGSFNPRLIIKHVLKDVVDHYTKNLQNGEFPPAEMGQSFRYTPASRLLALDASVRLAVRQRDKLNPGRREVLLDLWSDGQHLVNLDPAIHKAFDLPELGNAGTLEPTPATPKPVGPKPTPPKPSTVDPLAKQVHELNLWVSGDAKLSLGLADDLRKVIFGAIQQFFPWDTQFLLSEHYKDFKNTSIVFPRQQTQIAPGKIVIQVPRDRDDSEAMAEVGVLLQGLLRFEKTGGWTFPNAERVQRSFARYLEDWSGQLRNQIRILAEAERDPVPVGIEVLAIGAKLLGAIRANASDEEIISCLFGPLEAFGSGDRAPDWRKLVDEFLSRRSEVIQIVLRHAICTKGGSAKTPILDAAQFAAPLARLRENGWRTSMSVPDLPGLGDLERVHSSLERILQRAIDLEAARTEAWWNRAISMLGDDPRLPDIARLVNEGLKAASDVGMGGGKAQEVEGAARDLADANVSQLLKRVGNLKDAEDLFAGLAQLDQNCMRRVSYFVDTAEAALDDSRRRIDEWLKNSLSATGKEVVQLGEQMAQDLSEVTLDLQSLARGGR